MASAIPRRSSVAKELHYHDLPSFSLPNEEILRRARTTNVYSVPDEVPRKVRPFRGKAEEYALEPVPSIVEFEQLWDAWDLVTQGMVSKEDVLSKPINLRHQCIFYLGHIPAFFDIHVTRSVLPSWSNTLIVNSNSTKLDSHKHTLFPCPL